MWAPCPSPTSSSCSGVCKLINISMRSGWWRLASEEGHPYSDASLHQPLRIEMLINLHTPEQLLDVGDGHGAHIHDHDPGPNGPIDPLYKGLPYHGNRAA